jgi:hypothetical protein
VLGFLGIAGIMVLTETGFGVLGASIGTAVAVYRDLLRSVHEWPIGRSGYVRFGLYLLIPLGSWALAALVEHVVDALVFPG